MVLVAGISLICSRLDNLTARNKHDRYGGDVGLAVTSALRATARGSARAVAGHGSFCGSVPPRSGTEPRQYRFHSAFCSPSSSDGASLAKSSSATRESRKSQRRAATALTWPNSVSSQPGSGMIPRGHFPGRFSRPAGMACLTC